MDASDWQQRYEVAQQVVDETLDALPEDVGQHVEPLALALEDVPSSALRRKGFGPGLLGLFHGRPLRAPYGRELSEPTITLYLDNLWRYARGDWARYRQEVRKTYLHEIGHYLGLNEAELGQRNLR